MNFEESLPKVPLNEPNVTFVSFGSGEDRGLSLVNHGGLQVSIVTGVAAEAGIPIGSWVKYLHDEVRTRDGTGEGTCFFSVYTHTSPRHAQRPSLRVALARAASAFDTAGFVTHAAPPGRAPSLCRAVTKR